MGSLRRRQAEHHFSNFCDIARDTGVSERTVKAVQMVAAKANGYEAVMIADHGNADNALNADGTPNTSPSLRHDRDKRWERVKVANDALSGR